MFAPPSELFLTFIAKGLSINYLTPSEKLCLPSIPCKTPLCTILKALSLTTLTKINNAIITIQPSMLMTPPPLLNWHPKRKVDQKFFELAFKFELFDLNLNPLQFFLKFSYKFTEKTYLCLLRSNTLDVNESFSLFHCFLL